MKYVVIEYRNPAMDVCAHHPSNVATMWDGGDPWPVTSFCVSRLYDTKKEALKKLKMLFEARRENLEQIVRAPWEILDGYYYTLLVDNPSECERTGIDNSEWVFKMEVVEVPGSDEEAKLI